MPRRWLTAASRARLGRAVGIVLMVGLAVPPAPASAAGAGAPVDAGPASSGADTMDLMEAVRRARDHDAGLQAARWGVVATAERIGQARAALWPALSVRAATETGRVATSPGQGRDYDNVNGALVLGIPLFRPAERAVVGQARLDLALAERRLVETGQALVLRVATTYIDVLAALDAVEVAIAERRAIQSQVEAARRSFEIGTATATDQQEAIARLDLNLARLVGARNDLAVRRAALANLTGRPVVELASLPLDSALASAVGAPPGSSGPERAAADDDAANRWVALAARSSPAVLTGEAAIAVARGEIGQAKAGHWPTLDLVTQAQWTRGTTALTAGTPLDRNATITVGLQLAIPLYSGGLVDAREREAVARVGRAESDLAETRRQTELAIRRAWLGLGSAVEQARALGAAVRSSELALASNEVGYRVGVRINLDVLDAQRLVHEARRDLARARYDVLLSTLTLRAAAGSLDDAELARVNSLLAPRANRALSGSAPTPREPDRGAVPIAPGYPQGPGSMR